MKLHSIFLFMAVLMVIGCKKGENDPLLSLRSRSARLAGVWQLADYSEEKTINYSDGGTATTTSSFNGSTITLITLDNAAQPTTDTIVIEINAFEMNFTKSGMFEYTYDYVTTQSYIQEDTAEHYITEELTKTTWQSGNWSFLGAVKEGEETFKRKERILLNTLEYQETAQLVTTDQNMTDQTTTETAGEQVKKEENFASGQSTTTFAIDRLTNKEVILTMMTHESGKISITPSSGPSITSQMDIIDSDQTWTLKAK